MKNILTILILTISNLTLGQFTHRDSLMVNEINNVRTNPKSYIPIVESYIKMCKRKLDKVNSGQMKTSRNYNKHIDAANELIEVLNNMEPVEPLQINQEMQPITIQHAEYLKSINRIYHTNANGETADIRMKDVNVNDVTENIITDNGTIRNAVIVLLIDAEIKNRGHRENILNPNSKYISVTTNGKYWVMNFAN